MAALLQTQLNKVIRRGANTSIRDCMHTRRRRKEPKGQPVAESTMKNNEMKAPAPIHTSTPMQRVNSWGRMAIFAFAVVILFLSCATLTFAQGKNIVVLAPHPDDETLCCAGIIYNAL